MILPDRALGQSLLPTGVCVHSHCAVSVCYHTGCKLLMLVLFNQSTYFLMFYTFCGLVVVNEILCRNIKLEFVMLKIFFAITLQLFKVFNKVRLILRFLISVYYILWNGPVHSLLFFQLSSLGVQWLRESEFIVNSEIFKFIIYETLDTRYPTETQD